MYRCEDCGAVFETPLVAESKVEYWGRPTLLEERLCPMCGYDEFVEVSKCKCCGEEYTEDTVCEKCVADMQNAISEMIATYEEEHGCDYLTAMDILSDVMEGME